jgi:hypothetical protein
LAVRRFGSGLSVSRSQRDALAIVSVAPPDDLVDKTALNASRFFRLNLGPATVPTASSGATVDASPVAHSYE